MSDSTAKPSVTETCTKIDRDKFPKWLWFLSGVIVALAVGIIGTVLTMDVYKGHVRSIAQIESVIALNSLEAANLENKLEPYVGEKDSFHRFMEDPIFQSDEWKGYSKEYVESRVGTWQTVLSELNSDINPVWGLHGDLQRLATYTDENLESMEKANLLNDVFVNVQKVCKTDNPQSVAEKLSYAQLGKEDSVISWQGIAVEGQVEEEDFTKVIKPLIQKGVSYQC